MRAGVNVDFLPRRDRETACQCPRTSAETSGIWLRIRTLGPASPEPIHPQVAEGKLFFTKILSFSNVSGFAP
jgi:hypothetical protein